MYQLVQKLQFEDLGTDYKDAMMDADSKKEAQEKLLL